MNTVNAEIRIINKILFLSKIRDILVNILWLIQTLKI